MRNEGERERERKEKNEVVKKSTGKQYRYAIKISTGNHGSERKWQCACGQSRKKNARRNVENSRKRELREQ